MQTALVAGPVSVAVWQRDGIVRSQTSLKMASSRGLADRTLLKAFLGKGSAPTMVGQCVILTESACHILIFEKMSPKKNA